ncbi:tyrosine-type recombinase/integrase [Pseudonocardia sp. CA-142604]|uniref:tyrosine-type recombinase/integrase n=1 Tax=Pseudonocardia sp. CA-142604 TaxID=3240024 RepID=UPI003D8F8E5D
MRPDVSAHPEHGLDQQRCVDALRRRDHSPHPPPADALVFATANGTALDAHNVRRSFRHVNAAAGLNPAAWTPRELRHSFVSLLSASGVRIQDTSRLVGHSGTAVTERVYRHQLQAVLDEGTTAMDDLFPRDSPDSHSARNHDREPASHGFRLRRGTNPQAQTFRR